MTFEEVPLEPAGPLEPSPIDALERYRQLEATVGARIAVSPGEVAVVAIDADRLKEINDEYGHPEGNRYLQNLREVLDSNVRGDDGREGDTVVPLGEAIHTSGDEYWVILHGVSEQAGVDAFIARMQQALDELGIPVSMGGRVNQPGESAEELLKAADALMYKNKLERVPQLSPEHEAAFLSAVRTIEGLGVPLRAASLYLRAITTRREESE